MEKMFFHPLFFDNPSNREIAWPKEIFLARTNHSFIPHNLFGIRDELLKSCKTIIEEHPWNYSYLNECIHCYINSKNILGFKEMHLHQWWMLFNDATIRAVPHPVPVSSSQIYLTGFPLVTELSKIKKHAGQKVVAILTAELLAHKNPKAEIVTFKKIVVFNKPNDSDWVNR